MALSQTIPDTNQESNMAAGKPEMLENQRKSNIGLHCNYKLSCNGYPHIFDYVRPRHTSADIVLDLLIVCCLKI